MMGVVEFEVAGSGIDGLWFVVSKQVGDERGVVREVFRRSAFESVGVDVGRFEQINLTRSVRGVIRGMHAESVTKLVTVAAGEALGAYVDLRAGSASFGVVETLTLRPGVCAVVPSGVANGFQAVSETCEYLYCFDAEWRPDMPGTACTPLELGIDWPVPLEVDDPRISVKDRSAPTLGELRAAHRGEVGS